MGLWVISLDPQLTSVSLWLTSLDLWLTSLGNRTSADVAKSR